MSIFKKKPITFPEGVHHLRKKVMKQSGAMSTPICRCGNPLAVGKSFLQDTGTGQGNNVTYSCENCGIISCWNFDLGGPALIKKWERLPPSAINPW